MGDGEKTRAQQHAEEKGRLLKYSMAAAEEVDRKKDEEARTKALRQAQEQHQEEEAAREVQREAERVARAAAAQAAQVATPPPLRVFDPWMQD
eukprot:14606878-Heterocapsa_arctica.AAC.1